MRTLYPKRQNATSNGTIYLSCVCDPGCSGVASFRRYYTVRLLHEYLLLVNLSMPEAHFFSISATAAFLGCSKLTKGKRSPDQARTANTLSVQSS